jgi:hypothetical protein
MWHGHLTCHSLQLPKASLLGTPYRTDQPACLNPDRAHDTADHLNDGVLFHCHKTPVTAVRRHRGDNGEVDALRR